MESPLISIVMPAFNAGSTILEAISSVLDQSWQNWELLVVDNASTDGTAAVVHELKDPRIVLLHQSMKGVGHARNTALVRSRGAFYCFLDADDRLPRTSLADRAALLLQDPSVHFADGAIQAFSSDNDNAWYLSPSYRGPAPLTELFKLSSSCFLGPTWMIRRTDGPIPLFRTDMTHAEDLLYYMSIAHRGAYDHVPTAVLYYRVGNVSAMSDLNGLHQGYRQLIQSMRGLPFPPDPLTLDRAWARIRSIMWKSQLKRGRVLAALKAWAEKKPY